MIRKEMTVDNERTRPNFFLPLIVLLLASMTIFFIVNSRNSKGYMSQTESPTSQTETPAEKFSDSLFHMERVGCDANFEFYRDPVTDVLYIRLSGYGETGLITMQDPETGLPLTYSRYLDLHNNLKIEVS